MASNPQQDADKAVAMDDQDQRVLPAAQDLAGADLAANTPMYGSTVSGAADRLLAAAGVVTPDDHVTKRKPSSEPDFTPSKRGKSSRAAADMAIKKSTFVDTSPSEDDSQGSVCIPSTLSSPKTESSKISVEKRPTEGKKYKGSEKKAQNKWIADNTPAAQPSFIFSASTPRDPVSNPFVQHIPRDPMTNRFPRSVANQWCGVKVYKNEAREDRQRIERNALGIKATPESKLGEPKRSHHKKATPDQSPATVDTSASMGPLSASAGATINTPKNPSVRDFAKKLVVMENTTPSTSSSTPNMSTTKKNSNMDNTTPTPAANASASNPDIMATTVSVSEPELEPTGYTTIRTPNFTATASNEFVTNSHPTVSETKLTSILHLTGNALGHLKSAHDITQAKLQLIANLASAAASDDAEGVRLSDYLELFQEISNFATVAAQEIGGQIDQAVGEIGAVDQGLTEGEKGKLGDGVKEGYVDRKIVLDGLGVADDWDLAVELTKDGGVEEVVEDAGWTVKVEDDES